jgi:DNA (cytosine-5)-methyltransferase 1
MDYKVSWSVKNATNFGIPQSRERIFIVGSKEKKLELDNLERSSSNPVLSDVLESGIDDKMNSEQADILLEKFDVEELHGKSIKDTRGGENNIHSWDLELRGETNEFQREILSRLLRQRRRKKWARNKGIKWMDGMPLTEDEIRHFMRSDNIKAFTSEEYKKKLENIEDELDDLVEKNYLSHKYPKDLVEIESDNGQNKTVRRPDKSCKKGYDIKTGKLSFEISEVLDPNDSAPTLVATDVDRLAVSDGHKLRQITMREGLRLFGYPEDFELDVERKEGFDLLGNTVPVNIVEDILKRMFNESENLGNAIDEREEVATPDSIN